jgi:thioredoxin-related protein
MTYAEASRALSKLAGATLLLAAGQAVSEPNGQGAGEFLGGVETTYPAWFKNSFLEFSDDVAEAAEQGKRLIIFFHQDGCPYCNALVERNLSQKHIEDKVRAGFDVVALNLRGDREVVSVAGETFTEKSFARALKVQFTPTLLFLNEQGERVLRLNGYVPPAEFEAALDYVAQGKEDEIDYRDYLAGLQLARRGGELNRAAFFAESPYDLSAAAQAGQPVAVFFEQPHCPNCDTLHTEVLSEPETRDLLESFHAVQLDMWSDEPLVTPDGTRMNAREWAGALDVRYAPTIVVFSPSGEEIIRAEAFLKRFHTQTLLDYAASGAYREEADFQRFLTERADAIRARGEDVNIWQ